MVDNARRCLVEFLSLVAIVVLAGAGSFGLTLTGHTDAPTAGAMLDIVKIGFGAIVALAYAARGVGAGAPPSTTTTTLTTTTVPAALPDASPAPGRDVVAPKDTPRGL